jgi:hypothetical protein
MADGRPERLRSDYEDSLRRLSAIPGYPGEPALPSGWLSRR